jgi:hypothetical protein
MIDIHCSHTNTQNRMFDNCATYSYNFIHYLYTLKIIPNLIFNDYHYIASKNYLLFL